VNARRYPEALIDLKHALRIQPTNLATLTWDCLGKVVHSPDAAFRKGFLDLADEAVRLNHHSAESLCVRSVILAEFGQFEQAREGLLGVIARGEGNFYTRYQAALLALKLDDPAAYRGTCAALVTKFADSQNPNELYYTAWTCSLGPGAVEDHAPVLELARRDAEARPSHAGALQALGAALFRAGQFEEAREALTKAADAAPPTANSFSVYTRFFLAMTHHRLGQHEEAQAWFDKAEAYTEQALAEKDGSASLSWNRRLTLELLQSEAAAWLQQP
jgi:tetratricopeptide (TPR) repeat protein